MAWLVVIGKTSRSIVKLCAVPDEQYQALDMIKKLVGLRVRPRYNTYVPYMRLSHNIHMTPRPFAHMQQIGPS